MTKIIIATPSYTNKSGGSIALHKLCHVLNNLNYDAYIYPTNNLNEGIFYWNPKYNIKIANDIDIEKDLVIYPEVQPNNPFNGKNVVRYILNNYHLHTNNNNNSIHNTWGKNDYWLYYSEQFYDRIKEPNFLQIIDSKIDTFKDQKLKREYEACFTYRKAYSEIDTLSIIHPSNALEIYYNVTDTELISIFNICKRFYSYDTKTYLNVLASLCGCESIIVPHKNIPKENIILLNSANQYGIAYGLDDLERANLTRPLLRQYLKELEENQIKNTKIEFEKIFKYFNL
jgi:hypothetical protein